MLAHLRELIPYSSCLMVNSTIHYKTSHNNRLEQTAGTSQFFVDALGACPALTAAQAGRYALKNILKLQIKKR
jgi:hypothetical protein